MDAKAESVRLTSRGVDGTQWLALAGLSWPRLEVLNSETKQRDSPLFLCSDLAKRVRRNPADRNE